MENSNPQIFADLLLEGSEPKVADFVTKSLGAGTDPLDFHSSIYSPALKIIGDKFGILEIFISELILTAELAQSISDNILLPQIKNSRKDIPEKKGVIVLGTVNSDLHDIGKKMVAMMLSVSGYKVIDLGVNINTNDFIDQAIREKADILALSALLTTSMVYMKDIVEMRDGLGYKDEFAIIIGGAPVTKEFAETIGADGYGSSASDAVLVCDELVSIK